VPIQRRRAAALRDAARTRGRNVIAPASWRAPTLWRWRYARHSSGVPKRASPCVGVSKKKHTGKMPVALLDDLNRLRGSEEMYDSCPQDNAECGFRGSVSIKKLKTKAILTIDEHRWKMTGFASACHFLHSLRRACDGLLRPVRCAGRVGYERCGRNPDSSRLVGTLRSATTVQNAADAWCAGRNGGNAAAFAALATRPTLLWLPKPKAVLSPIIAEAGLT
jgi:hypothetical protein